MKTAYLHLLLLAALLSPLAPHARASDDFKLDIRKPLTSEEFANRIRASYGFLTAREPELNQAEYAIVEKFLPYIGSDPDFAIEMIEGLTENNPKLTASFDYVLGNLYLETQRLEEAIASFGKAIEKYPDFLRAWRALGWTFLYIEKYQEALEALSRAVLLGDTDPETFGYIGFCYYTQDEHLSALSVYTQALLYEPANEEWIKGKVASLVALNDLVQATTILEYLVRRNPDQPNYWRTLANTYIQREQPLKAIGCIEYLKARSQTNQYDLRMLGALYMNEQMPAAAAHVYAKMLDEEAEIEAAALLDCISQLEDQGLEEQASSLYDQFQQASERLDEEAQAALLVYQARAATQAQNYEEAETLLNQALARSEKRGEILVSLGEVQYLAEKRSEAISTLAKAETISDSRINALLAHAQILLDDRSYMQAAEKLEEALAAGGGQKVQNLYEQVLHAARKQELDRIGIDQLQGL